MVGGVTEASTIWDGITRSETLGERAAEIRQRLADRARAYDWGETLAILSAHPQLVNTARPGGRSLYAPLHQAAHGGAPADVISRLLAMGAWRTLRNASWERPVDVARARKHQGLIPLLEPVLEREVPLGLLLELQERFHEVIRGRANDLVEEQELRLPELEPLLETETPQAWFAVPGMYGGFD